MRGVFIFPAALPINFNATQSCPPSTTAPPAETTLKLQRTAFSFSQRQCFLAQSSGRGTVSPSHASCFCPRTTPDPRGAGSCDQLLPTSAFAPGSCTHRIHSTDAGADTSDSRSAICAHIFVLQRSAYSYRRSVPHLREQRNIVHASGSGIRDVCMV